MRYAIIGTDGELTTHEGEPDWDTLVGPEGKVRVGLMPSLALAAYVNDCGHAFPDRYPRNVVGSCVLAALGAAPEPYAGAVVFVGWNAANTLRGQIEIVPLRPHLADSVADIHAEVRRALAGDLPRELSPSWAVQIREIAEYVATAETPGLTIREVRLP
ncbi:hypothetical protein ACIP4S_13350 [Streptomyces chartreusis]|uniref:hypothetical protein n=1 Tax=Streptomyces chartreusis TaxID=1969 RepID=UPI003816F7AE